MGGRWAQRAELRNQHPDPLRRAILDTLDRVVADRTDLKIAARRAAGFWWQPPFNVWWGGVAAGAAPICRSATERDAVKTRAAVIQPVHDGRRVGLPHTFGWQKLLGPCSDGREVWETPTGEQHWLDKGAKLERVRDPVVNAGTSAKGFERACRRKFYGNFLGRAGRASGKFVARVTERGRGCVLPPGGRKKGGRTHLAALVPARRAAPAEFW
jgi:hypothetical protein